MANLDSNSIFLSNIEVEKGLENGSLVFSSSNQSDYYTTLMGMDGKEHKAYLRIVHKKIYEEMDTLIKVV